MISCRDFRWRRKKIKGVRKYENHFVCHGPKTLSEKERVRSEVLRLRWWFNSEVGEAGFDVSVDIWAIASPCRPTSSSSSSPVGSISHLPSSLLAFSSPFRVFASFLSSLISTIR